MLFGNMNNSAPPLQDKPGCMAGIYNSSYTALVVLSRTDFCQWRFPHTNLNNRPALDLRVQTSRGGDHFFVATERQTSTPSRKLRTICEIKLHKWKMYLKRSLPLSYLVRLFKFPFEALKNKTYSFEVSLCGSFLIKEQKHYT